MTDRRVLTDATLEAMLARRAGSSVPDGLAEAIGAEVEATAQQRRPAWAVLFPPPTAGPALRRAWIAALAGLLLIAATAAALVGSELLRRAPELSVVPLPSFEPAPTVPAPTVAPSNGPAVVPQRPIERINALAFAPDGSAWLATGAGVVHWDLVARTAIIYGQDDGLPTTEVYRIVIGPDGSVWAGGGSHWLARFDGPSNGSWTVYTDFGSTQVTEIGGIAIASDGTLWAAASDAQTGSATLLTYDGSWKASRGPDTEAVPWAFRLAVAPDGKVWAGAMNGVARFDRATWTTYTGNDLPRTPNLAGVGRDGAVWVTLDAEGCVATSAQAVSCAEPAAGVARFDGTHWTVYTTSDGLPADDVAVTAGADGSVWATSAGRVARFDGAGWTTVAVPDLTGAEARLVAPDGALWFTSPEGFLRYDGSTVSRWVLPTIEIPSALPALQLMPLSGPTTTRTALGTITWRVYGASSEHHLWAMASTPHGPIVVDGSDLRWPSASGAWAGVTLPVTPWRVSSVGDDVIAHGQGAVRLTWDGSRWVVAGELTMTGLAGTIEQIVVGPAGTVATAGTRIVFSVNGRDFTPAARPPDADAPELAGSAGRADEDLCPRLGGGSWPGEGSLGPVLATRDGFVVLAAARAADWNERPLCEPVLWASPDGSTWTLVSPRSPFGKGAVVEAVATRGGRHVAVGHVPPETSAVWLSDDGLAWERLPTPARAEPCEAVNGVSFCIGRMAGVIAVEAGWLIWSWDGAAWTSTGGRTWEPLRGWPAIRGGYMPPSLALGPDTIIASGSLPGPWHEVVAVGTIER